MSVDEVKRRDRLGGVIAFARRSLPELRRDAETILPVDAPRSRRALQLLNPLRWTRLTRPEVDPRPRRIGAGLVRNFVIFVVAPTFVSGIYLFLLASDQYVVESRFAVRGETLPLGEVRIGEFSGLIQKNNNQDTYIVAEYIRSTPMLESAQQALDVRAMFTRREADFWARYSGKTPIEELLKYWRKHVQTSIDLVSGIITLKVAAFTPEDGVRIAQHIVGRAEALINGISERAQEDMLRHSREEVQKASDRLTQAYVALREFRNRWGIIDPIKSAEATYTTMIELRKEKIKLENDLQVLRSSSLDEKSRSIQAIVANIAALDQQLKHLQESLTSDAMAGDAPNAARALLEYERLVIERTVAERLHESAVGMLERARIAAGKQSVYLATFVPPAQPQYATLPERPETLFVIFFCLLVAWGSATLLIEGVKDHNI
ncbi:capsule polysaccharide export protein-like protein [Methylobacterium sp. 4-46]|uniref:capsule polysaccharide transporter n=1 Tax=unclassified Methylobacterium TaxID=2615210 RepID=UPI000152D070|nr:MULTISPECIES: capsule polysaccharide transporter [Methylobacterium]ACA19200.1 capsule polysaccharide export protein-like protein [Methylobacterium sp. 4-46]WFT78408.1 capsule biosynthesis protein [Methylobacterium nodulans]